MIPCVKVLGADFELANALETGSGLDGHAAEAARLLLEELPGFPRHPHGGTAIEWRRRFLPSCGGSAYVDSGHLEINLPEHTRAADHAAVVHAGLRLARDAQVAASARLPGGRVNVFAAVSDGHESWGHHLNVLVRRRLFDDLFTRKPVLAGFLATHLATASIFTGHGQVGPGNRRGWCDYQLSQRADWFEELVSLQTMHHRPLLNTRDEPHAGDDLARMHIIYFDNVLCPIANELKAGTTQFVLAMAEAGWADPTLLLDDPLAAAHEVSRDLALARPLRMAQRGRSLSAVEMQRALADLAGEFVASGEAGDSVPGAEAIITRWRETLDLLAQHELEALGCRCDWALKYLLLERQRGRRGLSWHSAELKRLDLLFSSLDPEEGLFWRMAEAGQVEAMPGADLVDRFASEPPDDTRAYLRAHVLRRYGEHVLDMDWERVRFRIPKDRFWWSEGTLLMPDPARFGRADSDPILQDCVSLPDLIEAVSSETSAPSVACAQPWRPTPWGMGTAHTLTPPAFPALIGLRPGPIALQAKDTGHLIV